MKRSYYKRTVKTIVGLNGLIVQTSAINQKVKVNRVCNSYTSQ